MKLILFTVLSIVVLFAVVTAVSLLFPSTVVVSRAIDINGTEDSVLSYTANLQKWKFWVEGMKDSSVIIYSPLRAQLNKTGVTIDSIQNKAAFATWVGSNGRVMQSMLQIIPSANKENRQVTLHWQFVQHLHWYPWEKFASMMNDKILGVMMEKNLSHLKDCIEKQICL